MRAIHLHQFPALLAAIAAATMHLPLPPPLPHTSLSEPTPQRVQGHQHAVVGRQALRRQGRTVIGVLLAIQIQHPLPQSHGRLPVRGPTPQTMHHPGISLALIPGPQTLHLPVADPQQFRRPHQG